MANQNEDKDWGFSIRYEDAVRGLDIYPDATKPLIYGAGLASEAGEVCGLLKKLHRDHGGSLDLMPMARHKLLLECGDCLWYIARILDFLGGYTIEDAKRENLEKLFDRRARGAIQGSGDER